MDWDIWRFLETFESWRCVFKNFTRTRGDYLLFVGSLSGSFGSEP